MESTLQNLLINYNGLFMGSVFFWHYTRVWKIWAPLKCRFFIWLAAHNRCWTADRLAKRGLNHPEKCLLCDQAEETLDHLLVACSFSRIFWYQLFRKFGLHSLAAGCHLLPMLVGGSFRCGFRSYQKRS
jgi:hypothetical protein